MRTMPMTWGNAHDGFKNPCASCGKGLKGKQWAVHVISGGSKVLHPDDETEYQSDAGEMGCHFIGPECRKKFGEFAIAWNQ
jgi:hypothetical protein